MLHNKRYLYKYVKAKTVLKILEKRTLKYSSPILFNDPFDTQTKLGFDFEISEYRDALPDELYRLIHKEEKPNGIDAAPFLKDIQLMWQKVKKGFKITKDKFLRIIQTGMMDGIYSAEQIIERMNAEWISLVKASRVFCVTEEPDNLLMWAHYSEEHTGAVIEFKLLPELDLPLYAAKKVRYVEKPPVIGNLDGYTKYYTGQGDYSLNQELFNDMILSKSKHWEYEKEWRVVIPPTDIENPTKPVVKNGNEILFELVQLNPQEIRSIYFGLKMSKEDKERIEKYLTGDFEHVKKYNCIKSSKEYKLEFKQIVE